MAAKSADGAGSAFGTSAWPSIHTWPLMRDRNLRPLLIARHDRTEELGDQLGIWGSRRRGMHQAPFVVT